MDGWFDGLKLVIYIHIHIYLSILYQSHHLLFFLKKKTIKKQKIFAKEIGGWVGR